MRKRTYSLKVLICAGRVLAAVAIITAAAAACVVSSLPPHKVAQRFVVVVADRGRPIEGVTVVVTRSVEKPTWHSELVRSLTTDKSGLAPINGLEPGRYFIYAERAGVRNWDTAVEVGAGAGRSRKKKLELERPGIPILRSQRFAGEFVGEYLVNDGRPWFEAITHNPKKGPLANALLTVTNATSGEVVANGVTDGHGGFEFGDIPPGLYFLHVQQHPGKAISTLEVDGDIAIEIDPKAERVKLPIRLDLSDCGLMYELARPAGE